MPQMTVIVEASELLGYAQDNNIATWNEACDIIYPLYPTDGDGTTYVDPMDMEDDGYYSTKYPKLCEIVIGFAKLHEEEFKTYSGGFTFTND